MATFWKTRRRGWQRGSVLETGTTSHTSPQRDARLAKGIALGEVRPEDMCVADTDLPPTTILENRAKKPWDDIRSLLKAARERTKRIGQRLSRRKQLHSPLQSNQLRSMVVSPPPPQESANIRIEMPLEQKTQVAGDGDLVKPYDVSTTLSPDETPDNITDQASTGISNPETPPTSMGVALLVDGMEIESTEARESVVNSVKSDGSIEVATLGDKPDGGADFKTGFAPNIQNTQSGPNLRLECIPGPVSSRIWDKCWISSAVTIKDGQGEENSEMGFYDTLSDDNLSTPKFASAHKLVVRPILERDLKVYDTPKGPLSPLHYVETELKDPKRGIRDFVKVRFVLVEGLGGMGLVLGNGFMSEYGVKLDPTQGRDMYPVTARKAGPG